MPGSYACANFWWLISVWFSKWDGSVDDKDKPGLLPRGRVETFLIIGTWHAHGPGIMDDSGDCIQHGGYHTCCIRMHDQGRMDIRRDIHRAGQTWMDSCTPAWAKLWLNEFWRQNGKPLLWVWLQVFYVIKQCLPLLPPERPECWWGLLCCMKRNSTCVYSVFMTNVLCSSEDTGHCHLFCPSSYYIGF